MKNAKCPKCGRETAPETPCLECSHATNGATSKKTWTNPQPPPEVANWVIEPVPPEIIEEFNRTFNEEEYWAEFRETMQSGGADIDALIARIERKAYDRN